jgi:hypothetical protein
MATPPVRNGLAGRAQHDPTEYPLARLKTPRR